MSITVPGFIQRHSPEQLLNVFPIENSDYTFTSIFNDPLPPIQSIKAELKYDNPAQLIGGYPFTATLQAGQLNIQLENGVHITGTVQPPLDFDTIEGFGSWTVN